MNLYLWTKTIHLWLVVTWMATAFGLPLMLECAVATDSDAQRRQLLERGYRLYRLGHHLFGWAFFCGLVLWLHFGITGPWLHVKLAAVTLLLVHFTLSGRWIKRALRQGVLPRPGALKSLSRWPVAVLAGIIWLVVAKPI